MIIKQLGRQDYLPVFQAMQAFTQTRTDDTEDELWLVEHESVYTLGLTGKREHLLIPTTIPVIQTDRGGQITYHGLGQLVIYPLFNIKRLNLNIRQWVSLLEQALIQTLNAYQLTAYANPSAPGVYIQQKKIGSIGLRVKNNASYHGLSLNNNMDLKPFRAINPCGYAGLEMTQLADFGIVISLDELAHTFIQQLQSLL